MQGLLATLYACGICLYLVGIALICSFSSFLLYDFYLVIVYIVLFSHLCRTFFTFHNIFLADISMLLVIFINKLLIASLAFNVSEDTLLPYMLVIILIFNLLSTAILPKLALNNQFF
jgi:hypothetical protein